MNQEESLTVIALCESCTELRTQRDELKAELSALKKEMDGLKQSYTQLEERTVSDEMVKLDYGTELMIVRAAFSCMKAVAQKQGSVSARTAELIEKTCSDQMNKWNEAYRNPKRDYDTLINHSEEIRAALRKEERRYIEGRFDEKK